MLEINGINFNGKHSFEDFNLIMNSKTISTPSKKKIKIDVPFMNGNYDFSTIGSNGEITYNQRTIEVHFTLLSTSKIKLHVELTKVVEWLQSVPQDELIFDDIKDYYFLAEVENEIAIEEKNNDAEITITFIANPFKTGVDYALNSLWDTFNFEEDYLQDADYDIVGTKTITIYNPGRLITPTINCNATMTLTYNSVVYNLIIGDNKPYGLRLANGANDIIIIGTGHIKILFKKVNL